jgi:hypothetical protein
VEGGGITDIDEVAEEVTGKVTGGEAGEEDGGGGTRVLATSDIVNVRAPAPDGEDGGEVEVGLLGLHEVPGGLLGEGLGGGVSDPWGGLDTLLLELLGGGFVPLGLSRLKKEVETNQRGKDTKISQYMG